LQTNLRGDKERIFNPKQAGIFGSSADLAVQFPGREGIPCALRRDAGACPAGERPVSAWQRSIKFLLLMQAACCFLLTKPVA
jgi:hypothetical protein